MNRAGSCASDVRGEPCFEPFGDVSTKNFWRFFKVYF